jgi:non-specific serine/threonine protein kinase/serine/threonine-protein kinase
MERVAEVLEKAISLEAARRARYLDEACAGDVALRREVESLLDAHERAGSRFLNETPPLMELAEPGAGGEARTGRRIGAYQLEELMGHGGMGEVFAAVRADGQYRKQVALKLVRSGYDSAFVLERFRGERQILASLDHPNIARLLDGGTTEEGIPFLVMERVDGVPIDSYCNDHRLDVTARLHLFRQVCGAVQYAHQRLVIHRDIKPGNILVTQDGTPKLLDFGIAKILDESGNTEATLLRPMTPEFASPEQILGWPVTTGTDVYSLGVVLYRLLTGASPYRVDSDNSVELARAIGDEEPRRPSSSVHGLRGACAPAAASAPEAFGCGGEASSIQLQRRLRGDLDAIVLKALRKEPDKRYSSVDQFSEDIRRHLEGVPVSARKGTWSYRAGRFVQRHRLGVAASGLLAVTLIAAADFTSREASLAEANQRRAEVRFNDVRKLANSLLFEIYDSVKDLRGATRARHLILQRSLEYLDSMAAESDKEPVLLRELAAAYSRIAVLQGDPQDGSQANAQAALASRRKAAQIRDSLARLQSGPP